MFRKLTLCIVPFSLILLILNCTTKPLPHENNPPVLNSIEATPSIVSKGGVVFLNLGVTDPEEDKMYFEWLCPQGTFYDTSNNVSNTANPCLWQSPTEEGNYTISVTCTDSVGDNPEYVDTFLIVSVSIYSLDTIIGENKFSSPFAMCLDENGRIYVTDPGLSAVHYYNGTNWYSWNFSGFDTTIDTTFDTTVTPVDTIVDTLIGKVSFDTPAAITVDEDRNLLYIADVTLSSTIISVYDIDNIDNPQDTLFGFVFRISDSDFPIISPYSFVIDPVSNWFYISSENGIMAYDSTWTPEWHKYWSYPLKTQGIDFVGKGMKLYNNALYIACFGVEVPYAYSVIRRFIDITNPDPGGPTADDANFWISDSFTAYVNGLAIGNDGHIFVTEGGGSLASFHRVVEYDENGDYVRSFGSLGAKSDQFNYPIDIFIDDDAKIYVLDLGNHCIKVFKE